jgi:hypothetical protein
MRKEDSFTAIPKGTSSFAKINGVLPEPQDPTSLRKPINTSINTDIEKQYNNSNSSSIESNKVIEVEYKLEKPDQNDTLLKNGSGTNNEAHPVIIENTSSTGHKKKYTGVSQSGPMSAYQFAKLQFENTRDYLTDATSLGTGIFNYASEKKYFLLKEKLDPATYSEIIVPIKHYIEARKNLGLDKK